ncbi:RAD51B [Bugula neritina]|uniref:RAD51B n=1 Tax=Bugula neritina TaxID=10212 RepID=A0A7J7JMZ5_BUGNE|nr:RAD51B [Bugula neritina]
MELLHAINMKRLQSQLKHLQPKDVLRLTPLDLINMPGIGTISTANELLDAVSKFVAPSSTTLYDLLNSTTSSKLRTGLEELDRVLLGGLPSGTITELAGPSGSGKTQMCCQLSVLAAAPQHAGGLAAGALYIDTEGAASACRIREITSSRFPNLTDEEISECTSRIFLHTVSTADSLHHLLSHTVQELIIEHGIKLLIVDSIASLVRREFDSRLSSRSEVLLEQASLLKEIAEGFEIPVVLVNQVHTIVQDMNADGGGSETEKLEASRSSVGQLTVAMGNTWYHTVNTRLTLQYKDNVTRKITVSKSPVAAISSFDYIIDKTGLVLTSFYPELEETQQTAIRPRDTSL